MTSAVKDINKHQLIASMVGRELSDSYPKASSAPGEVILKAENITNKRVHGVSFELRRGEILGFSGLVGAGRTELARAIFGADPISEGEITFKGEKFVPRSPSKALESGIGLIPEDRKAQPEGPNIGLISSLCVYAKINELGFIDFSFLKPCILQPSSHRMPGLHPNIASISSE